MIAKFTFTLIGLGLFVSCIGQTYPRSVISEYLQIGADYEVCPPKLEYGYPLRYNFDNTPPRSIIFLKSDDSEPEKINDSCYVVYPSKETAHLAKIFVRDTEGMNYFIVPDSNLTYYQLRDFLYELAFPAFTNVLLVGLDGAYSPLAISNYQTNRINGIYSCGPSDVFSIKMNSQKSILAENEVIDLDTLSSLVFCQYWDNYFRDISPTSFLFSIISLDKAQMKVETYFDMIKDDPDNYLIKEELDKWRRIERMCEKFGELRKPGSTSQINLDLMGSELDIGSFYFVLDQINKGLFEARERLAYSRFNESYKNLLNKRDLPKLAVIHFELSDLIWINNIPPPGDIQIIDDVPKK